MCVVRVSVLRARQDSNLRPRDPNEAAARSKGSRAAAASRRQQPRQHPPRQGSIRLGRRAASALPRRMLPGDLAAAARPNGSIRPPKWQHPPRFRRLLPQHPRQHPLRSGGCCPAAGQQPPHHSRVLHHACADASWAKKSGSQTNRPPGVLECFSDKIQKGHLHRAEIEISEQGRGWCGVVR